MRSLLRFGIDLIRLVPCLLIACMTLPSAATVLINTCPTRPQQWVCFGYIESHGPLSTTRIFQYKNLEMLVESEQAGKRWRSINTRKGNFVDNLEGPDSPGHSPFTILNQALAPIFLTLPLAYPDGPGSVPAALETRTVRIDHRNTATVITSREAGGGIRFDIRIVGDEVAPVKGIYRAGLLPALPGDFDLHGWYQVPIPGLPGQPPRTREPAPERLELLR